MSITERVQQVIANSTEFEQDKDFIKLREFYEEMDQAGIVKKPTYSLPPLDTVGKRFHELTANQFRR